MSEKRRLAMHGIALFVLALLLRLPGLGWGLQTDFRNQSLHPDELVVYNFAQEIEPFRLHFVPGNYNYPTLYPTLLRLVGDAAVLYTGTPDPLRESRQLTPQRWGQLAEHQRMFHLAGRVISCVAGACFALACFLFLARRTLPGGWCAGLFAATAPLLVVNSRWQTVDMVAAAFFAFSVLFASWILDAESDEVVSRLAMWSGVFAGLSAGTKYIGIVAVVGLLLSLALKRPSNAWNVGVRAILLAVLVFLVTTPGAILNWERFRAGLEYEMRHTREGRGLYDGDIMFVDTIPGYLFQMKNVALGSAPVASAVGLLALLALAWRGRRWTWVLLGALVPLYLSVGASDVKFSRYAVPLVLGPAVGFGACVGYLARRRAQLGYAAAALALIGFEGPLVGLRGTARYTAWMMSEDPRDQAAGLLLARAEANPQLTVGLVRQPWYYTVPVFPDANYSFHIPREATRLMIDSTQSPRVVFPIRPPLPELVVETELETMHARRLKSAMGMSTLEQSTLDDLSSNVEILNTNYDVERQIGAGPKPHVDDLLNIHPTVTIYRRTSSS